MADQFQTTKLPLFLVLLFLSCFTCFSYGYQFVVGGGAGWVSNPSENYNNWAQRMRFQVNDTLLFKYNRAVDSVLVVNRDDYDGCNSGNPIQTFNDGSSAFKFDRSGPFYFITGNQTNCNNGGQKLFIIVMSVRNRPSQLPPANSPTSAATPPQGSSSPAPASSGGSTATPPGSSSPSPAPAGGSTATPPGSSSPSPAPAGGPPATAHSPAANIPSGSSSTTAGSPGGTPAGNTVSPPRSFAGASCDPSFVVVSAVSLVLSVVLGGLN